MSQTIIRIPTHHAPPRPLPTRRNPAPARAATAGGLAAAAEGAASLALAGLAAAMLAAWGANLLAWPWWPDLDTFAEMAQGWAEGDGPYSDSAAHSFPGQIYLFAALGRAFGWGATWPIYSLEILALAAFGAVMAGWSRRLCGAAWPGLLGALAFGSYYMGLGYSAVAQRDGQAALLASTAVLLLQASPGRGSRLASAALFAAGLTVRPHVVLWLPGVALALAEGPEGATDRARRLAGWLGVAAATAAGLYLPIALDGQLIPWLRNLRALGDPANYGSAGGVGRRIAAAAGQFQELKHAGVILGLAAACGGRDRAARAARAWLATLGCVLWYAPLSPASHDYLTLPLRLVGAIGLGATLAAARAWPGAASPRALAAMLGLGLALAVPSRPAHCLIRPAIDGLRAVARGEEPQEAPSGYRPLSDRFGNYPWADARGLRALVRATPPDARVANLLMGPIALNGATGRRSLLRNESGFYMTRLAKGGLRESLILRQAADLARGGPDDRVAWVPAEFDDPSAADLAPLPRAVRAHFALERRVGAFEVWRRLPEAR